MSQRSNSCPCCSGKAYDDCCQPYHNGELPPNALALMRSRYSAYARGLASYIIATTHPDNPQYKDDLPQWTQEILAFCQNTRFRKLEIHEFIDGDTEAYVTFTAHLAQQGTPFELHEKSHFLKQGPRWLYKERQN